MNVVPPRVLKTLSRVIPRRKSNWMALAKAIGVVNTSGDYSSLRPDKTIKDYINIYKKDARVRSAIDLTAYYAVGVGWKFVSDDDDLVKRAEALREQLKLDQWMENALKVMLITGDCYTEIRKDDDGGGALVILPSEQMNTNMDKYGNVPEKGAFVQVLPDGSKIEFDFEQIHHMYRPYSSEPEGLSILAAAKYPVDCLWSLEKLMLTITDKFAAPLLIAKLGNAEILPDEQALNDVKNQLKKLSIDKSRLWAVPGVIDFQQIESARAAFNISPYLDYFERQIYAALNVPPILMGKPEGSNRTSARVMMDSFERYVKSLQRILADSVKVILHRFGFGDVPDIIFNEISPEDDSARVLRIQRMLGSDRSTGWITVDEARQMSPEVHGTWKEAMEKQSIPDYDKIAAKSKAKDNVKKTTKKKRQQPKGKAPGEAPEEPEEPEKEEIEKAYSLFED